MIINNKIKAEWGSLTFHFKLIFLIFLYIYIKNKKIF